MTIPSKHHILKMVLVFKGHNNAYGAICDLLVVCTSREEQKQDYRHSPIIVKYRKH